MTVTYTISSGVDTSLSTKLNKNFEECFKYLGSDQTAANSTSTSETELGEVTIPANTVTSGVLVIATGSATAAPFTFKLRAGTSATATSNTQYKSITRTAQAGSPDSQTGWTIVYYINDLTWSSTNYVHITGTRTGGSATNGTCESIEVLYL